VITVLANTPATSAGIMLGDLITEVDGIPAGLMSQAEFSELLQRSEGTVVQFGVIRDGLARLIALTLQELLP
jgi:C-terminal processing protease CtpA/Prc